MREIDRLYTARPFFGSRQMLTQLRNAGHQINRKRVQRLMQTMELQALVQARPAP
jgi:putative transposase